LGLFHKKNISDAVERAKLYQLENCYQSPRSLKLFPLGTAPIPKALDRAKMTVAELENSMTSGKFRVVNSKLPLKTISTSKSVASVGIRHCRLRCGLVIVLLDHAN
jgi:hypothetical protein